MEYETIKRVQQLLVNLKNQGMIKGVYAKDHNYLVNDLDDIDDWLHDPNITWRKNKSIIECFFEISTEQSMY